MSIDLIDKIRLVLNWESADEEKRSIIDSQNGVFEFILRALKRSRELCDLWLKSIMNSSTPDLTYPIDIIVLIIMSTINEDRSSYLESLLKRKIKAEIITREIFGKAIEQFPVVISRHLKVFFEFMNGLFKDKGTASEYGEMGYK